MQAEDSDVVAAVAAEADELAQDGVHGDRVGAGAEDPHAAHLGDMVIGEEALAGVGGDGSAIGEARSRAHYRLERCGKAGGRMEE